MQIDSNKERIRIRKAIVIKSSALAVQAEIPHLQNVHISTHSAKRARMYQLAIANGERPSMDKILKDHSKIRVNA